MNIKTISLDSLSVGDSGFVSKLLSKGELRRRMLDLGLVKGTYVESLMK
ncbi:MAG: FeoA family protein, partial [Pseudoruminococcus massiliensis]